MKLAIIFTLLSFVTFSWATADWKVVAESMDACKEKHQVLAKEGEKFVYVTDNNSKTKLASIDGAPYSEQSGKSVTFSNKSDESLDVASKRFTFTQPSMVDGNLPRLHIVNNGVAEKCKMQMK